jgi:predicted transcriptional regulator
MADAVVTISAALAAALDAIGAAVGRSRAELAREAIARYVLEEKRAIDRVVAERFRQSGLADDGDSREGEPTGGEAVPPAA